MKLLRPQRPARRAVILVLTLWIVLVLSLLAQSLAFEMQVETRLASTLRDQFLAEQLARIGVARASTDLRNDLLIGGGEGLDWRTRFDALGDVWAGGSVEPRPFTVTAENERTALGSYELLVVDEESKLDLNCASPAFRGMMKNLLLLLEVDDTAAQNIANAIWDWKDADDLPAGGEGESEIDFYSELLGQAERDLRTVSAGKFFPKNSAFDTVDELLQIPGMTAEVFYGYDPAKTNTPAFFPSTGESDRSGQRPGLKDLVQVRSRSLNANTAGREVLAAVLGEAAGNLDSGRSAARKIVDYRQGGAVTGINNNKAFRNIEEMVQIDPSLAEMVTKARGLLSLTTQSDYFTIYCEARRDGGRERVRNSGSATSPARPVATARIIARCRRSVVPVQGEDLEDWEAPGIKTQSVQRGDGKVITAWALPAIYFSGWNAF